MIFICLLLSFVTFSAQYSTADHPLISQNKNLPNLYNATLDELTSGLKNNDFTSVDLVKAYLARIREVNDEIKAVTELNPDALEIAAALDAERARGNASGLLHGIPILLKGNMGTLDKLNTTAGSYALLGARVPRDSTVAKKIRASGAIILGKANLSQWAAWRGNASNGWSAYGGQGQGVYYPQQDPSGSSSGSAVSTALGLAFAAFGTETAGSLILPGQASNVVAIKPTVGLTSRYLVVPLSQRQDTVGTLARTVRDAATMLQTIAGRDSKDNYTSAQPAHVPNYVKACKISALSGARIGIPQNLVHKDTTETELALFYAAIKTLRDAGATIVDNINITDTALAALLNADSLAVLTADFRYDLSDKYLSKLRTNPNNIKSLGDLQKFTQQFPLEDYKSFPTVDTSHWDAALALNYTNNSPEFWAIYQRNLEVAGRQGILGLLTNYSLDALVAPTSESFDLPARIGTPVIQVPLGFDNDTSTLTDLPNTTTTNSTGATASATPTGAAGNTNPNPVGISFMGAKWSEEKLIGFAYAFEQKTKVRDNGPQPYLLPKTQLADVIEGHNSGQKLQKNASAIASNNIALGGVKR